jgi:hypothetical protein
LRGAQALERSAGVEAQSTVQRALALLPRVATSRTRMQLEGRLQVRSPTR